VLTNDHRTCPNQVWCGLDEQSRRNVYTHTVGSLGKPAMLLAACGLNVLQQEGK